jgi:hypothetical protein
MKCSLELFGDVAPGLGKGCWCDDDKGMLPYEVADDMVVEKCGKEGEECDCATTVHYGDGDAKDFKEMSKTFFKTKELTKKESVAGFVNCDSNVFGDPHPSKKKQCFCERQDKPKNLKPDGHFTKCGSEDDKCECQGRVFYGREDDDDSIAKRKPSGSDVPYLTPKEMFAFPW